MSRIDDAFATARSAFGNLERNFGALRDATRIGNPKVIWGLLPSAARGFILQRGKLGESAEVPTEYSAYFNFNYTPDHDELHKLYSQAKRNQWDGEVDLDWQTPVDPQNPAVMLIAEEVLPLREIRAYQIMNPREKAEQRRMMLSWLLSQFLHGEQGALFAACQLTEAVHLFDAKLYGSTQVVDEGRHVEVFSRYLIQKLEHKFDINDNLYVILDALMTDKRWDMKFLGMQIMIEGLALGAFQALRHSTDEPLLKELLRYVITDEARHVHFGVVALEEYYRKELSEKERQEREDWAFEMALLMRNRFLAHEIYDAYYSHDMTRANWDAVVQQSNFMQIFRKSMFKRIIPNLKRIHLLSPRVRPYYEEIGLLGYEHEKAAPELTAQEMY